MAFATTLSTQKISASAAPITDYPYTFWVLAKAGPSGANYIIQILSANNATGIGAVLVNGKYYHYIQVPSYSTAAAPGIYSTSLWNTVIGIGNNMASRVAILNGASAESTVSAALVNLAKMDLLASLSSNTNEIAECAIWSAALNADEQNSLTKGFSPRRIRPQSRVFYGPLIRNLQDLQRALALTPVNSPTVSAHPRVYA